jgi:hypothetical protein
MNSSPAISRLLMPAAASSATRCCAGVSPLPLVDIAAAIPWSFISSDAIESRDVRGVNNLTNAGFWDYSFTSLR